MAPRFSVSDAPDSKVVKEMEDALNIMHNGPAPFQWQTEDGELLGPYGPLACSPGMVPQFFALAKKAYDPTIVKPRNRELAIMGLCSVLNVPNIVDAHRSVAARVGLSDESWVEGLAGKTPSGLTEEESMAYQIGRHLTTLNSRLDDDTFNAAVSALGKSELVGILHTIAGYKWVALLVNVGGNETVRT